MTIPKIYVGAIIALLFVAVGIATYWAQFTFGAPAIRDENNIPAVFGSSCEGWSATKVAVGHQAETTIQASTTRRALLRIEQPLNATNTVAVGLNGTAAVANQGIVLSPATTTDSVPMKFEAGLTTEFPYTGPVTVITGSGSTTVNVTTCTY